MKNTKRALGISLLALLLCVSMFVGITFAWFTDSVTVAGNKIQSGTLDIKLYKLDPEKVTGDERDWAWEDISESTEPIINYTNWEPGYVQAVNLRIENVGSLAAKIKVNLVATSELTALADVIDVYMAYGPFNSRDYRTNETYRIGTLREVLENGIGLNIPAGAEDVIRPQEVEGVRDGQSECYACFALKMREEAGNEYQGMALGTFDVRVLAVQATVESDSFDNQYDKDADGSPDNVFVKNTTELNEAMAEAGANTIINLDAGVYEIDGTVETEGTLAIRPGTDVTLDMGSDGKIVSSESKEVNEPVISNKGNLTIVGGTIENKNATAGNTNVAAVRNVSGTLTLENCTIKNVAPTSGGDYAVVVEGGVVNLENCKVEGGRGAIAVMNGGELNMKGGSATAGRYYPVYLVGSAKATFNGVTFVKNHTKSLYIIYNELTTGTASFTGCTFESSRDAKLVTGQGMTGLTIVNCSYTRVAEPA